MFKKITLRCAKTAWALFATCVVLLAIVISLLKVSLPYANNYKADIEQYLLQEFGADVRIGSIGASWQQTGPVIVLEQITLIPSPSAPLDISIAETRIEWNFWESLKEQRVVTGAFLLEGVRSRIDSNVLFKKRQQTESNELFESLSHLFLSQVKQFKIIDSFIIVDYDDGRSQDFQIDHLSWVNQGNRHQGQGEVFIDGFSNNSLAVIVDLYGQRRNDIFGQIYVEANQMDVTPWLQQLIGEHVKLSGTEANFSVWGDVQNGLVENILLDISRSGLSWTKQGAKKFLRVESATVQWWKAQENWLLFGNQVQLESDEHFSKPFDFTYLDGESESQLYLNNVELPTVTQLFSLFSATRELNILADTDFSGQVDEFQLNWGEELPLAGVVKVSDFAFLPKHEQGKAYAGVEGLELTAHLLENNLWLQVRGEDGMLSTADTFSDKISYQTLVADTLIHWDENDISISSPRIIFNNEEVSANLAFEYTSLSLGHLSIYGEIKGPTAGNIPKYLPQHLIGDNTYKYLINGIQQGRGELTRILIDGVPAQLPFVPIRDRSLPSTFVIQSKLRDGQFMFNQNWPAIENLNAMLTVDKSEMTIAAESGQLTSLPINNDVVTTIQLAGSGNPVIVDIFPKQLDMKDFHQLVDDTPLTDIIGGVFDFVRLDGAANAKVNLNIPIDYSPDDEGNVPFVVATGDIATQPLNLSLPRLNLDFNQSKIHASFVNEKFSLAASESELFGLPVSFEVSGAQELQGYKLDAQIHGDWDQSQIHKNWPLALVQQIEGHTDVTFDVDVNINSEGYQYFVNGNADLTDIQYDVTGELSKRSGEYGNLNVSVIGDQDDNEIVAKIGQQLEFVAQLPMASGRIEQASLQLGREVSVLPEQGFDIGFALDKMEFEPTLAFVLDIIDALPESSESKVAQQNSATTQTSDTELPVEKKKGFIDAPTQITGSAAKLDILGLEWNNVSVNAQSQQDGWLFSVGAKETLSDIKVYNDIKEKGVEINASFLNIVTEAASEKATEKAVEPANSNVKNNVKTNAKSTSKSATNTKKVAKKSNDANVDIASVTGEPVASSEERASAQEVVTESADAKTAAVKKAPTPLTNSDKLIASLPPLSLNCQVCTFNGKPLGQMNVKTRTEGTTLYVEQFDFEHKRTKMIATGRWVGDKLAGRTEVNGKLDSRYFGQWLQDWGLNSGIKDSDGKIDLVLNWQGAPYDFAYERLNGTLDFRLGEGYLSEISDGGARIFSLFSLDSLYRKLKFDFNDVFEKGLFYNNIKGDLVVTNGVAITDNIKMDGVAGAMSIKGQTDLAKNTLDYNVSFKPKVTSSLPAIAAWFAPADGGLTLLAAIALDKFIETAPVFSEIKIKVTGDINKPNVQEVERFTRTVKLPEEVIKKSTSPAQPKTPNDEPNKGDGIEGL